MQATIDITFIILIILILLTLQIAYRKNKFKFIKISILLISLLYLIVFIEYKSDIKTIKQNTFLYKNPYEYINSKDFNNQNMFIIKQTIYLLDLETYDAIYRKYNKDDIKKLINKTKSKSLNPKSI